MNDVLIVLGIFGVLAFGIWIGYLRGHDVGYTKGKIDGYKKGRLEHINEVNNER